MRDPRGGTWMAMLELEADQLRLIHLEATGRSGFQATLRDAGPALRHAEAIGLAFPFGLPVPFAERLLGGPFPEEGWWALAKRLDKMSRPDYLVQVQEFADSHGELRRLTDEAIGGFSPLHRSDPDLGPMTYHGVRMIAEERSRFAVRPFESAQGRLLLEVSPRGFQSRLQASAGGVAGSPGAVVRALGALKRLPVAMDEPLRTRAGERDALDAVLAARCAAVAVLSGEVDRSPEELAPGHGDQVRHEGWIYGLNGAD